MPWRERSPVDERVELVAAALAGVESVRALSDRFEVSRKTAHKWIRLGRRSGLAAVLAGHSRRPHRIHRIAAEVEERIVEVRRATGYGGRNISDRLAEEGVWVSPSTVDRVIARRGLGPTEPRGRAATQRFCREAPNELWQMDFKAEYRLRSGERCMPLSLLDDHSRFAIGLAGVDSFAAEPTQRVLRECFERYGVPEAMLMDHGSPWWSTTNGQGLTRVSVALIEQGITLYHGAVRHPQTQGKVERFHRTLDRALRYAGMPQDRASFGAELERFRSEYNHRRPHSALDRQVPAARYAPSPRPYQAKPQPWEYPDGAEVRRLNGAGVLDLPDGRFFVCEALAGKEVWCRRYGQLALITYRHMYVRELDLLTGRTTAVVRPARGRKTEPDPGKV